jgi:hypothetical protein
MIYNIATQEADRVAAELEDLHERFDKSMLEVKNLTEEKERFEVEARKYRNQVSSCFVCPPSSGACALKPGNTKGGSIVVPLTSCLTGSD